MGNSKSSQSKIYGSDCIIAGDDVYGAIGNCKILGWSWSEDLTGVHHTAIVLYLDDEPRFTVNWTPENGTKAGSTLFETRGQLVFEDERLKSKHDVSYKDILQYIPIEGNIHEDGTPSEILAKFLDELTSFKFTAYENHDEDGNAKFYDLTICNCRDHVLSVMRRMHDEYDVEDIPLMIEEVKSLRNGGAEAVMYRATAVKAFIIDVALIPIYTIFSGFSGRYLRRYVGRIQKKLKPAG